MFRESYGTLRLFLGLVGVVNLISLFSLFSEHSIFDTSVILLDGVIGLGALYLMWNARTLVPRWSDRILKIIWTVFGVNVLSVLYYVLIATPDPELGVSGSIAGGAVGIGISFLVTAYIAWNIRRLAQSGDPTRKDMSRTQFIYWGIFVLVLIVITYFITQALGGEF